MSLIGRTVNRLSNRKIQIIRFEGFYDSGRYERRQAETREIRANVQPARGSDLERLPENYRQQSAIAIFTLEVLRTGSAPSSPNAPGVVADRVVVDGIEYEIMTVENWPQHFRYIATRASQ